MYDLPDGGRSLILPACVNLDWWILTKQEVSHYFPEMRERLNDCQFNNCLHVNEPGCAIKDAVEDGDISEDRYVSYINILGFD